MSKCPHCDKDIESIAAPTNSSRKIILEIDESEFPMFRATFREMNVKFGMQGFGELANQLNPYADKFNEDFETMRFFDDRSVAMAFRGVTWGYKAKVIIGDDRPAAGIFTDPRVHVDIEFTDQAGKKQKLNVADNATRPAAERFKTYFEDAAERVAPMEEN